MYTATKLGHTDDKQTQRRIVTIEFSDGEHEFVKDFSFRLTDTIEVMRKTIGSYLTELNATPEVLEDGLVDTTVEAEVPVEKTADELAKEEWDADWAKLLAIQPYIDAGVFTGSETPIVNLRNKVKTGFKPEYLGL